MLKAALHQGHDPRAPQLLHYSKGDSIYFEGDRASAWFSVAKGVARTCRFYGDGHRQLTGFHYAGDVFGLERETHQDSAEAVTDLSLWRLGASHDGDGSEPLPSEPTAVEPALRKALASANRCIFLFGRRTAPERLAAFLLVTAERIGARANVDLPMSRTDIADYLGLTIHTVSRTLTQMSRDRMIAFDGAQHCRILDIEGLRSLAGEGEIQVIDYLN